MRSSITSPSSATSSPGSAARPCRCATCPTTHGAGRRDSRSGLRVSLISTPAWVRHTRPRTGGPRGAPTCSGGPATGYRRGRITTAGCRLKLPIPAYQLQSCTNPRQTPLLSGSVAFGHESPWFPARDVVVAAVANTRDANYKFGLLIYVRLVEGYSKCRGDARAWVVCTGFALGRAMFSLALARHWAARFSIEVSQVAARVGGFHGTKRIR
jgi:hypothetical protein